MGKSIPSGIVSIFHVFKYNLLSNTYSHGSPTFSIMSGFSLSLMQSSEAHPLSAFILFLILILFMFILVYISPKDEITANDDYKKTELNGIFYQLTHETGGNIHDNGTIEITSNSISDKDNHPKNLVDFEKSNYYESSAAKNATICFDLKNRLVQLNSYSIKSFPDEEECGKHLREWVIEGSIDGEKWEILDEHINDSTLKGPSIISNFLVNKSDLFFRFIRFRQTGPTWHDADFLYLTNLCISKFEIFGKLKKNTKFQFLFNFLSFFKK